MKPNPIRAKVVPEGMRVRWTERKTGIDKRVDAAVRKVAGQWVFIGDKSGPVPAWTVRFLDMHEEAAKSKPATMVWGKAKFGCSVEKTTYVIQNNASKNGPVYVSHGTSAAAALEALATDRAWEHYAVYRVVEAGRNWDAALIIELTCHT